MIRDNNWVRLDSLPKKDKKGINGTAIELMKERDLAQWSTDYDADNTLKPFDWAKTLKSLPTLIEYRVNGEVQPLPTSKFIAFAESITNTIKGIESTGQEVRDIRQNYDSQKEMFEKSMAIYQGKQLRYTETYHFSEEEVDFEAQCTPSVEHQDLVAIFKDLAKSYKAGEKRVAEIDTDDAHLRQAAIKAAFEAGFTQEELRFPNLRSKEVKPLKDGQKAVKDISRISFQ